MLRVRLSFVPLALSAALLAASCGSSSHATDGGGGGGGGPDTTPPSIGASPPGGDYPEDVLVTLSANEPATIYYTTDGGIPIIGGASTLSGTAPIEGILLEGPDGVETTRLLSFFGVDVLGNAGPLQMREYTIDKVVPQVSQQGADPPPVGILDSAVLTWFASDDGDFAVRLGGDGSPGSGTLVDSGTYSVPGAVVQSEVPGALLHPSSEGENVFVTVADAAGNEGTATLRVALRGFASTRVPSGVLEMRPAVDPVEPMTGRLYVASGSPELVVVDTGPHEVEAKVALGCVPTGLAALPDGSRVYVGCASGILSIDAATLSVDAVVPVPNGATPTGLAATPTGHRVYFGSSDGLLLFLDTASEQVLPTGITDYPIESCRTAITPSPAVSKGFVAWKGAGTYGAFSFDAPTGFLIGTVLPATPLDPPGGVAVTSSVVFERGFLGDFQNRLTRVALSPPAIEQFTADASVWGLAVLPGSEFLLLTHPDDLELEFRATQDLELHATYELGLDSLPTAASGLGQPIAIERIAEGNVVVTRAYVVREDEALGASLVRVPVATDLL